MTDEPITHIVVTPPKSLTLVQLSPPDHNGYAVFQIRNQDDFFGFVVASEAVGEFIRKTIRGFVTPDHVDHNYSHNVTSNHPSTSKNVGEGELTQDRGRAGPSPAAQPRSLDDWLEQCGYDPLREERVMRDLSLASTERMDARRAGLQKGMADEWRDVYDRAVAAGIPLKGESFWTYEVTESKEASA